MKKITSLLLVLIAALGMKAQTTETYDFYNFATGDGYMTATGDAIAIDAKDATTAQYFTEVYKVENLTIGSTTMDFNNRFAFNPVGKNYQMYWRFRNTGTNHQKGLVNQWNANKTANTTANISILGLYNGDKVTIKYGIKSSAAKLFFVKSGIATLEGVAISSGDAMESDKTYTIVAADENATVNLDLYITNNNIGIHTVTITSSKVAETVEVPTLAITGAYNGERTITITSATEGTASTPVEGTYYTTDGTDPSKSNGTRYIEPFIISENTTIKAISYLENGIASEITTFEAEAGTTLPLNNDIIKVTSLTEEGDVMHAIITNVYTSEGVLGNPTTTFTYTFNGETVKLPYSVTESGVFKAIASADGYASTTETLELEGSYIATRSLDFVSMSQEYFVETYGDTWAEVTEGVRLANWSKSYTYYGTTIKGGYTFDDFLSCIGSSSYPLHMIFGSGVGRATGSTYKILNGSKGEIAVYEMNESLAPTENYVQHIVLQIEDANMAYAAGASQTIAKVCIYSPVQGELTLTEGADLTASGVYSSATYTREIAADTYGTICLPFAPDAETLENYSFFRLESEEEGALNFVEEATPAANTPYLYCLKEGKEATAITGGVTTVSSTMNDIVAGDWTMKGSFTNQTIATAEADTKYYGYAPANNQVVKANKTLTILPYRAYFTAPKDAANVRVRITRGDETTAIDNAQLTIDNSQLIYDLQGRRVESMTKGIYIVNGKKVIF